MIEIKIYGEDPAKIKQQMLELFSIEPNNTIAINIQGSPDPAAVKAAIKDKGKPAKAPAEPQDAPAWTDNALAPAQDTPQPVHVQPALAPQPEEVPIPPAMRGKIPPSASALRELLGQVSDKCGSGALAELLAGFNVKQFSKIPVDQYLTVEVAAKSRLEAQA